MIPVGVRELSHHTSRYLAQVKAGHTLTIIERGRVIAVVTPAGGAAQPQRAKPKVGGYRSERPLTAAAIEEELARGFGADDDR